MTKVIIPEPVYKKIMYWVNKADFEVSGMGTVTVSEPGIFVIEDVFLLKQEGTSTTTDIDANAMGKAMYEVHSRGLKGSLNFWWHSHVNMSTFWSGTDTDTIKQLGANGYLVASVFNKKEEVRSAFCTKAEIPYLGPRVELIDDITTEILVNVDTELEAQWCKEFDENVTRKTYQYQQSWNYWDNDQFTTYDRRGGGYRQSERHGEIWWQPKGQQKAALKEEARLLGMAYGKYLNIINNGTDQEILELETELKKIRSTNGSNRTNQPTSI